MSAKPTVTTERFLQAMRSTVSPSFSSSGNSGDASTDLPLDKKLLTPELVVIERWFPETLEVRCIIRKTLVDDGKPAQPIMAQMLVPVTPDMVDLSKLLPEGAEEIDSKTGKRSWVPTNDYAGIVEAIGGDGNGQGYVLIGYVHMVDETPLEWDTTVEPEDPEEAPIEED